jgi:type I restriction enzyme R subunit
MSGLLWSKTLAFPTENFKYGFEDAFLASLISRMDQNQEIFTKIMDDDEFSKVVKKLLLEKVYTRLRETRQF